MSIGIIFIVVCLAFLAVDAIVVAILVRSPLGRLIDPDTMTKYYEEKDEWKGIKKGCTLEIIDDSKMYELQFHIRACHNITTKYIPEEYHYGSVTVGGVTTGGVYKTGGKTKYYIGEKNGTCFLENYYIEEFAESTHKSTRLVSLIKLTPEMLISAKKSEIAKYLDDENNIDTRYRGEGDLKLIVNWLRNYKKTPS